VAGGLLTQYLGWRAVFLVNPPLILIMLSLLGRLPKAAQGRGARLDYRGAAAVTTAIGCLIFGLSYGQQHGFTRPVVLAALAAAVLLGVGFVRLEQASSAPMLPLSLFRAPARRAAVAAMVLIGAVLAGYVYFVSLFLQKVLHFSPLLTGGALIPSTLTVVAMSTLGTRRLLRRLPAWQVLAAGLACLAGGQLWLSQVSDSASYLGVVLPGLILTSLGIGLSLPTAAIAITTGVRREDQGLAGALFTTGQQTGAAVGLAVLATVAAARTARAAGSLAAGYRLSFLVAAGFMVLAVLIVVVQMRPRGAERHPVLHDAATAAPAAVSVAETQLRNC
jgi:predicted MFS family arabinose efflux permease